MPSRATPAKYASDGDPSPHSRVASASPRRFVGVAARCRKDDSLGVELYAPDAAANISMRAVFPDPLAPMIVTSPLFSSWTGFVNHLAFATVSFLMISEESGSGGGFCPM